MITRWRCQTIVVNGSAVAGQVESRSSAGNGQKRHVAWIRLRGRERILPRPLSESRGWLELATGLHRGHYPTSHGVDLADDVWVKSLHDLNLPKETKPLDSFSSSSRSKWPWMIIVPKGSRPSIIAGVASTERCHLHQIRPAQTS